MVTMPTSANSRRRSFVRTSDVSIPRPSSRSSVPSKRAPRGTAIVSRSLIRAPPRIIRAPPRGSSERLLRGLREVHALYVEREPAGGQVAAEAADQLVVAPPAAQGKAHRRVVDLEHGAGVVAELTHQPEVEDHAVGHPARLK